MRMCRYSGCKPIDQRAPSAQKGCKMITVFDMASGQQDAGKPAVAVDEVPLQQPVRRQETQLRLLTVEEAIAVERKQRAP